MHERRLRQTIVAPFRARAGYPPILVTTGRTTMVHDILAASLAGVLLGLPAGALPGPMTALVIGQTLRFGPREGLIVAFVPWLTDGPLLLVAAWMTGHLTEGPWLHAISLLGALVCGALAWETAQAQAPGVGSRTSPKSIRRAVAANLTNPHPYIFWLTVGGPFMAQTPHRYAAAAYALSFLITLTLSKVTIALLTAQAREPILQRWWRATRRVLAMVLLGFGAWLGWQGVSGMLSGGPPAG